MGKLQKKESWLQKWMKKQGWTHHRRFIGLDIQSIIMAVLTALTLITTITIGLLLYNRFKMAMKQTAVSNAESMVESTVDKLDAELLNVRQIMNAVNYNIIQEMISPVMILTASSVCFMKSTQTRFKAWRCMTAMVHSLWRSRFRNARRA